MIKKLCLQFPKPAIQFFGLKMTPLLLWHFSKKIIRICSWTLPLRETAMNPDIERGLTSTNIAKGTTDQINNWDATSPQDKMLVVCNMSENGHNNQDGWWLRTMSMSRNKLYSCKG